MASGHRRRRQCRRRYRWIALAPHQGSVGFIVERELEASSSASSRRELERPWSQSTDRVGVMHVIEHALDNAHDLERVLG